jgi:alkanesulfonate monooxygenase SsuD/methylene tetrahydromethanopterin reductase-like flavin-dependent oxidoreductase (luciferase family)
MIPLPEARAKVAAVCAEIGRDPREIRWANGGSLFLHDDPRVERQAVAYAIEHYGGSEADIRAGGLFGSVDAVREGVRRQIADGADEVIVFQLPRAHLKSVMRFSDEVIPEFA